MTDPRRLLARLSPTTIRYDIGRGGIPELTAQDIAAAIAFVPAGLGREVLCALWWPDGSRLSQRELVAQVTMMVGEQWRRQAHVLIEARTDLGIAHALAGWHGRTTDDMRRNVNMAQKHYDAAKAKAWPQSLPDRLPALIKTALEELGAPNSCAGCGGRGSVLRGDLVASCEACGGAGSAPVSDSRRARSIGIDESSYRRVWDGVYTWLLRRLSDAEIEARRNLQNALRSDDAGQPTNGS